MKNPVLLRSFNDFEKDLSGELTRIHEIQRPIFVLRAYDLAQQKFEMDISIGSAALPRFRRQILEMLGKARTQIRKAIKAIQLAKDAAPMFVKDPSIVGARDALRKVESNLDLYIGEFARLPSKLDLKDKQKKIDQEQFPVGHGFADVDYWLIEELDNLLNQMLTTRQTQGNLGRVRIIAKVFKAAFSDHCELGRITTALKRIREGRRHPTAAKVSKHP